ncbi:MAG: hypothetical protein H0W83_01310 [Planctomycetes bacterium]|nr:hypothetical protein [Planctomycetota bacterium]
MTRPPWSPTHRITVTFQTGTVQEWLVMMVLSTSGATEFWPAATEDEWRSRLTPKWACDFAGRWTWRGLTTPNGAPAAVTIASLVESGRIASSTQFIRMDVPHQES